MEGDNTEIVEKKEKNLLRRIFTYPILCLEAFLLLAGEVIGMSLSLLPSIGNKDIWETIVPYAEFIGIWITTFLFLLISRKNRPILMSLGKKSRGNTFPLFLLGLLLGSLMNGLCALSALLHHDISLSFNSFDFLTLILLFVAVFIQSGAEELVCRGFLFQKLRQEYKSPLVAVIGNAVFFASLHLFNDGVTFYGFLSDLLIGILCSLIVYYLESIWCAMALHTAWNFTQNIILGLPNSGALLPYSVFKLEDGAKSSFFYDTGFGIEGSLFSSIVITVVMVLIIMYGRKHNPKPRNIWKDKEEG